MMEVGEDVIYVPIGSWGWEAVAPCGCGQRISGSGVTMQAARDDLQRNAAAHVVAS